MAQPPAAPIVMREVFVQPPLVPMTAYSAALTQQAIIVTAGDLCHCYCLLLKVAPTTIADNHGFVNIAVDFSAQQELKEGTIDAITAS